MAEHEHEHDEHQEEAPTETPRTPQEPLDELDEAPTPGEGDESPETPEEPESTVQPQGTSEKDIEKAMDKLGREAKRHRDRISEVMGEDALALLPCELCWPPAPGFRFPQIPEDQRASVMLAIGFDPDPDFRSDTQSAVCADCDGWGQVATGSKVQGQKALPCTACKGKGWRGPREARVADVAPELKPTALGDGPTPPPVSDSEREAARREAEAKGYMVIDTRAPAAT